jgi:membrane protein
VITDFMHTDRKGVLSIGILTALFFSSNGMMGLMRSFDRSAAFYKARTGLSRRWTALKLTFFIIGIIIVSSALLIIQTELLNKWITKVIPSVWTAKLLSVLILIAVIFFAICVVYTYGPSLTKKLKFISAGAVFATAACVVTTYVFFFLVNNILHYNKVYGSIGTLTAFMVWVWLNTMIILIGFELNVSILLGKQSYENDVREKKR